MAKSAYNIARGDVMNENIDDDWSAHNNCAHIPNAETIAAMREAEEIIKQIRAGDRRGCMTWKELKAEMLLGVDDEDEEIPG